MKDVHFWHCAWKVVLFVWRVKNGGKWYSRGKAKVLSGSLDALLDWVVDGTIEGARVVEEWESELLDIIEV
jgi:hypothetical protein